MLLEAFAQHLGCQGGKSLQPVRKRASSKLSSHGTKQLIFRVAFPMAPFDAAATLSTEYAGKHSKFGYGELWQLLQATVGCGTGLMDSARHVSHSLPKDDVSVLRGVDFSIDNGETASCFHCPAFWPLVVHRVDPAQSPAY
jgi:hypothetical protein